MNGKLAPSLRDVHAEQKASFVADKRLKGLPITEEEASRGWAVASFPFSSARKRATCIVALGPQDARLAASDDDPTYVPALASFRSFTKGAPAGVLASCTHYLDSQGHRRLLDDSKRKQVEARLQEYQHRAMRTLALAFRDFDSEPEGGWMQEAPMSHPSRGGAASRSMETTGASTQLHLVETELTLIAVVGIEDPLRPGIKEAIISCRTAGVDVRMCTGDALETAIAIATQCGILNPETDFLPPDANGRCRPKPDFCMTGAEFDERIHILDYNRMPNLRRCFDSITGEPVDKVAQPFKLSPDTGERLVNRRAFDEIWPKLRVLARCQPEDKLTLVRGIKSSRLFKDLTKIE